MLDDRDRKLLTLLQKNADMPIGEMADLVSLSSSACWRRIKRLTDEGFILSRVAVLDRGKMNVPLTIYVLIRTSDHSTGWTDRFRDAVAEIPEISEAFRLTGNIDYLLKVVLPDVAHWDMIYQKLVRRLNFSDVSSYIAMEEMKNTGFVPTSYI
ncbi:Lrp/AsnC ligand binding domain-containing protein [Pseudooceanicola sp. CBS1P-1]|uniref:Winged helix-turn-helix transcriptional regulator n=1 Tax=Pseudooceanicola albus TaxID=2692189 RepID=A0A6L7G5W5_9RHOB|nr:MULTISPECIES: Lrp/AsnC family transcriptional regulator [Pseudooceanicola]MBT9385411.1 Lrp/AsnC ligand binding domain-containing protein [Pseudooceanicola endophyticus]MXN18730.1 winged helix-turn-helix transcriptional regulator [Pseudooceanicola albus]